MKRKPIVGETLILFQPPKRHAADQTPRIREVTVSKVGIKYFDVEDAGSHVATFMRSDWHVTDKYNERWNNPKWVFQSHGELEEWREAERLCGLVCDYFRNNCAPKGYEHLTADQLRRITVILDEKEVKP